MKMKKVHEYRALGTLEHEGESRMIHGLAIPVESRSQLLIDQRGGLIYETVMRSAVTDQLIKTNDVKLYLNHDSSQGTLARSKYGDGSMRLFVTERGLEFETELPDTERGNELLRGIERGDYDAVSFAFYVGKDHYDDAPNEDGVWNRYIDEFSTIDEISILSVAPAYSATQVDLRSLEAAEDSYKQALNAKLDAMLEDLKI